MRGWPIGWALAFQANQTGSTPVPRSMDIYEKLDLVKECKKLWPNIPAGTYTSKQEPRPLNFEDLFETCSVGFFPTLPETWGRKATTTVNRKAR